MNVSSIIIEVAINWYPFEYTGFLQDETLKLKWELVDVYMYQMTQIKETVLYNVNAVVPWKQFLHPCRDGVT